MKTGKRAIVIALLLAAAAMILINCGGGSANNSTTPIGRTTLSGTIQADPNDSTAIGTNSGATVYVVGQQDNATTTDNNGNFTLNVKVSLSSTILSSPSFLARMVRAAGVTKTFGLVVISSGKTHGRKTEITTTNDVVDPISTIYINTVGSIGGKAFLQGQTDHTGIRVYIPGTSFQATTDAAGRYTISGVPAGKYDFVRADYPGTTYNYAIISNVTVNSNAGTTLPDMLLQLSSGPNGKVMINNGDPYTTSPTVALSISTSSEAVLMQVSEDANMANSNWEPVKATRQFTFTGNYFSGGSATIWVKFADSSGLESAPISATIYIDTNPIVMLTSPASVTSNSLPTFLWSYGHPISNPHYHIQVAKDLSFTAPAIDVSNITGTQYTAAAPLVAGTYYWRAAIIDGSGKEWGWSQPLSFAIDLGTVSLKSPDNSAFVNTTLPTFKWDLNPTAAAYHFVLSTTADLSSTVTDTIITATSLSLPSPLPITSPRSYYWAVTPLDARNIRGARSAVWSFTVDTAAPAPVGSFTINGGDTFTSSRNVSLNVQATDDDAISSYLISENPSLPVTPSWTNIVPSAGFSQTLLYTLSGGSGIKTVHIWFRDRAGNVSSFSSSIAYLSFSVATIGPSYSMRGTSIALDTAGAVHFCYVNALAGPYIMYVTNSTGTWISENVGTTTVQPNCSLALDSTGKPHITFYDGAKYQYVKKNLDNTWSTEQTIPRADTYGHHSSIAIDSSDNVHICMQTMNFGTAYYGHILYTSNTTTTPWSVVTVEGDGVGKFFGCSIIADSSNNVHMLYHRESAIIEAKYSTKTAGSQAWSTPEIIANGNCIFENLVVDNNSGTLYSAGEDNGDLKYVSGKKGSWNPLITVDYLGDTGRMANMGIDSNGKLHIAYYTLTDTDLLYATNAFGSWITHTVDSLQDAGHYPAIAVNRTTNQVTIMYFNQSYGTLKVARTQ